MEDSQEIQELQDLIRVFAQISDGEKMDQFFREIFTESERKDLALRWQLMKMLNEKVSQREIASKLGISLCKITRGAKIMKDSNSVSKCMISR